MENFDWFGLMAVAIPTIAVIVSYWFADKKMARMGRKLNSVESLVFQVIAFLQGKEGGKISDFKERGLEVPVPEDG